MGRFLQLQSFPWMQLLREWQLTENVRRITTSHIEKQNHTLRMQRRRLSRLTNDFAKSGKL
jgi:hypothetical protein